MTARKAKDPQTAVPLALEDPRGESFRLRQALGVAALLAGAGFLAYANSLHAPFIFDDPTYIAKNAALRDLWRPWAVYPTRPVLAFTLALNWRLSGLQPGSYHFVNLCIHILAALALFGVLRRTLQGEVLAARCGPHATVLALATALLWLLHPLQTQAVTYVIQRGESLMGLFYLLALYCAIRAHGSARRAFWWAAAVAACALGLGTKQVMVTAPLVVLLYYWVFFPEAVRRPTARWWAAAVLGGLWLAASAGVAWLSAHATAGFFGEGGTPLTYAWTQGLVIAHYLQLAVWPRGLCLDYAWPAAEHFGEGWWVWSAAQAWAAAGLLTALAALTAWGLARRKALGFAGAWFFVILAPTSSFMPISDVAMEHRMYLPLAAVVALAVVGVHWGGARLMAALIAAEARRQTARRAAGWALLAVCAVTLGGLTALRNRDYRTAMDIWTDTLKKRPASPRAHGNIGALLLEAGRPAESEPYSREAIRLKPDYAEAYSNLGVALERTGRTAEAIPIYQTAARLRPAAAEPQINLGKALEEVGRRQEALACYQAALRLDPDSPDAHNGRGVVLANLGQPAEALLEYQQALDRRPDFPQALSNMASALTNLGRPADALPYCDRALALLPDNDLALYNRGNAQLALNRLPEATASYEAALKLNPRHVAAQHNLGEALARQGHYAEAREHYEAALDLWPGFPEAHYGLGLACWALGDRAQAEAQLAEAVRLRPGFTQAQEKLAQLRKEAAPRAPP